MESHGEPLKVHISEKTKEVLEVNFPNFKITPRGEIEVKGKGIMTTYWLDSESNRPAATRGRSTVPYNTDKKDKLAKDLGLTNMINPTKVGKKGTSISSKKSEQNSDKPNGPAK